MAIQKQITKYSELSTNTIRLLAIEAIAQAKSGHSGIALGAAPIMYALFRNHLNINPAGQNYFNRDRFVLSAGHGSALLYATMLVSGVESITMEDLRKFRQLNSKCPGHPENHVLPGVEIGTGPLGQGIAMAVGMAIAECKLANKFNKYGKFINHYTYALFGDGCLEEGVAQEAIALAGRLKLNKLILLYDSNKIQLDGKVSDSTNFNVKKLFKAYGWNYLKVKNANYTKSVANAISLAKRSTKPTIIECNSVIGYGSRLQNTNAVHGVPLTAEQIIELRANLNYNVNPFTIHQSVQDDMAIVRKRGVEAQRQFNLALQRLESKDINLYRQYIALSKNEFEFNWDWYKNIPIKPEAATRNLVSDVLQPIFENNEMLLSGSADLASSTLVRAKKAITFTQQHRDGQNLSYGVREFAMAAICNGIITHGGCKAIGSTFLSFSDYNKNAIRLAAITHTPAINIFSHDSLTVGEDGPTHQPIEQIPSLRLIPNHVLFRPCNLVECEFALEYALASKDKPVTIITSRGMFKQFDATIENVKLGAYVIRDVPAHHLNIVATGSEVATAIATSELLQPKGINARVISMPSNEIFEMQGSKYKDQILDGKPTISIEFASTAPWYKYVDLAIGIDQFGKSGKPDDVLNYFDLTPTKITDKIYEWYQKFKSEGENK